MPPVPRHPVLLVVIDGWGLAAAGDANAITLAQPKAMERLLAEYPSTELAASGEAVGLPAGQMGNSEVGHTAIGAGRVVPQEFVRISQAAREHRLVEQPAIQGALDHCVAHDATLHILGLLGPGGVHSHEDHLFGLLDAAAKANVPRIQVHHVLDGRDTPPRSAVGFAARAQRHVDGTPNARVATVSGRYWTMDRDKRWDRTQRAYRMLADLDGHRAASAADAIEQAYARDQTDEFVEPTIIEGAHPLRPGDALLVYNFRPDRVRQIVRALGDPGFSEFPTRDLGLHLVTMTRYDASFEAFGVRVAFPPEHPTDTLGQVYSDLGLRQLRIAETEKYAHVTYFFSGGREEPFPGEDRKLVPSVRDVDTYDRKPEMSARAITNELIARLDDGYDLIVCNFANPDMVGHTGRIEATVAACRVVDECIGRLAEAARGRGILLAVTADHGNAESMVDDQGNPRTAHTTNPVPFVLMHDELRGRVLAPGGGLANVAPTLLDAVGLEAPRAMDAPSLLALKKAVK